MTSRGPSDEEIRDCETIIAVIPEWLEPEQTVAAVAGALAL
jgi:hypothetical protein